MEEQRLGDRVAADKAEIELLAEQLNESTGLSWLWAFLFGPIYFAVHAFYARALILLLLNLLIIGFFIAPFLAYPAWRKRAEEKAEKMILLDRVRKS